MASPATTSSATGPPSALSPGTSTSYIDASASPGTSYTYTVDARDGAGNLSQPSAPATVTTPSGTASPTLVQAAGSTTATVTLPRPSTQGDLLVLSASVYTGATNHITSVTDSAGNTLDPGRRLRRLRPQLRRRDVVLAERRLRVDRDRTPGELP